MQDSTGLKGYQENFGGSVIEFPLPTHHSNNLNNKKLIKNILIYN